MTQGPYERGVDTPIFVVGVIAGGILGIGLLPPYYEIYKRQGRVVGISTVSLLSVRRGCCDRR